MHETKSLAERARRLEPRSAAARARYPHPIIAREGWPFIAAVPSRPRPSHWACGGWWAAPLWLVVAFMVQFFRDPPRRGAAASRERCCRRPTGASSRSSAARDPYLERDAIKMSVFMNVFNVHSNRSPVDGEVRNAWYHIGKFFNAALSKSSLENERAALWIRTAGRRRRHLRADRGARSRGASCATRAPAQRLARGERFGFIRFGSRVDVYLPPDARPVASVGDKVYATESILAVLPA